MKSKHFRKVALALGTTISIIMGLTLLPGIVLADAVDQSAGTATPTTVTASGSNTIGATTTYMIRPFDTLGRIAFAFRVTVVSILQANPNIADPSLIYAGEEIKIPTPNLGLDQNVWAGYSAYRATVEAGRTSTAIPTETAPPAANSTATVAPSTNTPTAPPPGATPTAPGSSVTTTVEPTPIATTQNQPTPAPTVAQSYIVRPANTLGLIANLFRVTVISILESNLNITNPNLIFIGQELNVPTPNLAPGQSIWSGYNFSAYPPVSRNRVVAPPTVATATPLPSLPTATSVAPTAQPSPTSSQPPPAETPTNQPAPLPTETTPPQPTTSNPYPGPGVPATEVPGTPYPQP